MWLRRKLSPMVELHCTAKFPGKNGVRRDLSLHTHTHTRFATPQWLRPLGQGSRRGVCWCQKQSPSMLNLPAKALRKRSPQLPWFYRSARLFHHHGYGFRCRPTFRYVGILLCFLRQAASTVIVKCVNKHSHSQVPGTAANNTFVYFTRLHFCRFVGWANFAVRRTGANMKREFYHEWKRRAERVISILIVIICFSWCPLCPRETCPVLKLVCVC